MTKPGIETRKEALRVMIGARKILREPYSWFGGNMGEGSSCALMAMNKVASGRSHYQGADNELAGCMVLEEANRVHRLPKKVRKAYYGNDDGPSFGCIPRWNDCAFPGHVRTKRQVVGVFTRVIKKLYASLPARERKRFNIR